MFTWIYIEDVVDDIASLKFLIMIDLRCSDEIYIIDELFPVLSDAEIDRFSWSVIGAPRIRSRDSQCIKHLGSSKDHICCHINVFIGRETES